MNHCFTCVIKVKSRNKLTVAEDDRHQGKSNSRNPFHSFQKTYEMTWDVARGKRVNCSESQRMCAAHFHIISFYFLKVMTESFYPATLFDKEPFFMHILYVFLKKI